MLSLRVRASLLTSLCCVLASACIEVGIGVESDDGDDDGNNSSSNSSSSNGDGDSTETGGGTCNTSITTEVDGCEEVVGMGFCSEGGVHVDQDSEIEYSNNPPHSGDHYPTWESWGEHDTPVPRGNWVHNLEHGGIALLYNCPAGCGAELDVLRAVIDARPDARVLMTEDPLLDGPRFAAVSWTWVHEFDMPDMDELLCFVDQHFNHAPENVP